MYTCSDAPPSVDCHPLWNLSEWMRRAVKTLSAVHPFPPSTSFISRQLASVHHLPPLHMRFQAFAKVDHAHDGCYNRHHQQEQRQHGKSRQGAPRRCVVIHSWWRVHSHEFEGEVRHGCEVYDDDGGLSNFGFGAADVCCEEQDDDSYGYSGDCEVEFGSVMVNDYDHELDREAQEKEEVEFEQSDVNL